MKTKNFLQSLLYNFCKVIFDYTRITKFIILYFFIFIQSSLLFAATNYEFERSFFAPTGTVFDSSISPDSATSVLIDYTHTIRSWKTTGELGRTIPTKEHQATIIRPYSLSTFVLTGGMDGLVRLYNLATGGLTQSFPVNIGPIKHLVLSKNGEFFLASGKENKIVYWRLNQFINSHRSITTDAKVTSLAVHSSKNIIAWSDTNGDINIWSLLRNRLLVKANVASRSITKITFDPSGTYLAIGGYSNKIIFWNWKTRKVHYVIEQKKPIISFDFIPEQDEIMSCSKANKVYIWNFKTNKLLQSLSKVDGTIRNCSISDDGSTIQVGFLQNKIRIWKKKNKQKLLSLQSHKSMIRTFAVSPDGHFLLSNDISNKLIYWNLDSKIPITTLPKQKHNIFAIQFSPDNHWFATGGDEGFLALWDLKTRKIKQLLQGYNTRILSLSFHPTKPLIAAVGEDTSLFVWNYKTKAIVLKKKLHKGPMTYVTFSKDGKLLASAGTDHKVVVLNTINYGIEHTFSNHTALISSLDFSFDNKYLASSSNDLSISIYDLSTEKIDYTLNGHEDIVARSYFLPNAKYILSASNDKSVRQWELQKNKHYINSTLVSLPIHVKNFVISYPKQEALVSGDTNKIYIFTLPKQILTEQAKAKSNIPLLKKSTNLLLPEESHVKDKNVKLKESELLQRLLQKRKERRYNLEDNINNIFTWVKKKKNQKLQILQTKLNDLLINPSICKDSNQIKTLALDILKEDSTDKVAYYALILTSLKEQNTMPILLLSKLGEKAHYFSEIYNFMTERSLEVYFQTWNVFLLDHTARYTKSLEKIELFICNGRTVTLSLPEEYIFLDLPQETQQVITTQHFHIDFLPFLKKRTFSDFRKYTYILIDLIEQKQNSIMSSDFQNNLLKWLYVKDSIIQIDLTHMRQWDNQNNTIKFRLKPPGRQWQTYFSDTSKFKVLFIPSNVNYYLKINGSVKKYISIFTDLRKNHFFTIK